MQSSEHDARYFADGSHRIALTSSVCPPDSVPLSYRLMGVERPTWQTYMAWSCEHEAKHLLSRQFTSRHGAVRCGEVSPRHVGVG